MRDSIRLLVLVSLSALIAACPGGGSDDDDSVADCAGAEIPSLTIISPNTATYFDSSETINWTLTVVDDGPADELTITLQDNSNSQGEDLGVDVPTPGDTGQTSFTMPADLLESGEAVVRVLVEDAQGCSTNDQVLLCIDDDLPICTN